MKKKAKRTNQTLPACLWNRAHWGIKAVSVIPCVAQVAHQHFTVIARLPVILKISCCHTTPTCLFATDNLDSPAKNTFTQVSNIGKNADKEWLRMIDWK